MLEDIQEQIVNIQNVYFLNFKILSKHERIKDKLYDLYGDKINSMITLIINPQYQKEKIIVTYNKYKQILLKNKQFNNHSLEMYEINHSKLLLAHQQFIVILSQKIIESYQNMSKNENWKKYNKSKQFYFQKWKQSLKILHKNQFGYGRQKLKRQFLILTQNGKFKLREYTDQSKNKSFQALKEEDLKQLEIFQKEALGIQN